ncbi:MAG: glycosyl hydrolase, partial [Acidobacteria bacterium]
MLWMLILILLPPAAGAAGEEGPDLAAVIEGLELRGIGPALMGGRIADLAVDPRDPSTWYVAVGSGGVWKTENAGITWQPIFDDQPSYSIGRVVLDPSRPDVVWVGTGENVSGRHVGWGDGVYKSLDGGRSWRRMGLERSEHVGDVVVDPRDGDVVYVAAEGPLWAAGGERGVYKTTDGGESWTRVLAIDDDTGATDLELDPRDPDVIYAATYQRRRHVWSLLAGGPGSGIHKSTDGGKSWRRLSTGLPAGDMGKIGLAASPADPDVIYATIEASEEERGFYRSRDGGESWQRMSDYLSNGTGPHYYQEIVASPHDVDTVYQMDVFLHVTRDGGATFEVLGDGRQKHSDNHALWIDPQDPEHLIAGTDGGLYESFDDGRRWRHVPNLPISQFYKLALSPGSPAGSPFYDVVGGAQDLGTLLGPVRTTGAEGVRNEDWLVPLGADGYDCAFDPEIPDLVYLEWQRGHLNRYDRKSGELIDVQPQPAPGEPPERWNWDAPLEVSAHAPGRLYFGSQRLWRSDDRGDSWRPISGDLSRGRNRYELPLLGRVWSVDALYDNGAMSWYGTLTAISESPLDAELIYAGTDDGRLQVTEDGGGSWRPAAPLPGVPELAFINDVEASLADAGVVYAVADAHKLGDFRPLIFKSDDRGRSWRSIAGDPQAGGLPAAEVVWALAQDDQRPELIFAAAEHGLFVTLDGGGRWIPLRGGVPTIAFRDLELERRAGDLVAASFGRGFYVLDDYAPLREIAAGALAAPAHLFAVRDAWSYVPSVPLQARGQPSQGSTAFAAPNPPFGAVVTYHLAADRRTAKAERRAAERKRREAGEDVPFPGWERLRQEARQGEPQAVLTVRDADGRPVRRLAGPATAGLHRIAWDLRLPPPEPIELEEPEFRPPWAEPPAGPLVAPGRYTVELALVDADGGVEPVAEPRSFAVHPLPGFALPPDDLAAAADFQARARELRRRVAAAGQRLAEAEERLRHLEAALFAT